MSVIAAEIPTTVLLLLGASEIYNTASAKIICASAVIIITDSTIYTIIRVQVGAGLVKEDNHVKFGEYLNGLNRSYKVFKYVVAENGAVFLDACLPSTNESFDPEVVRVVLDVIVDHLNQEYKNIMKEVWN